MTGKPKTHDEIHEAHDKLHLALQHIRFDKKTSQARFEGAMDFACWALGHEDLESGGELFQTNLLDLEFKLLKNGIRFKEGVDAEEG